MTNDKDKGFKFIEARVRRYPSYKKELLKAVNDIIHATPVQDDIGGGKSNLPSRPVENMVSAILDDARLSRMQKYVDTIESVFNELDTEKQEFFQTLYWGTYERSVLDMCEAFNIKSSTFYRWRRSFLLRIGIITGDVLEL